MDPFSLHIYSIINGNWVTIFIFIEQSLGLRYSLRHTHNVQIANRWYRAKHQPLKSIKYLEKHGETRRGHMMIPLVSFFSPSSPSSMFNLLNCIVLKIVALFWEITHYFLWQKLQRISHFKFEFFLPSSPISRCLLSTPPPQKKH